MFVLKTIFLLFLGNFLNTKACSSLDSVECRGTKTKSLDLKGKYKKM